eukprot:COSAG02_NODE_13722_length_1357_cov_1.248013_1_plen_35_part_01
MLPQDPAMCIAGLGDIALPLSDAQLKQIVDIAEQA